MDEEHFITANLVLKVNNAGQNVSDWPNVAISATEYGLVYCVHEIHARVIDGMLSETIKELPTRSASSLKNNSQTNSFIYVSGNSG